MSIDAKANVIWCEVTVRYFKTGELRTISGVLLDIGPFGFYLARDAHDTRGCNTDIVPYVNQNQGITKANGRFNGTKLPLCWNQAAAETALQPHLPEYLVEELSRSGRWYEHNLRKLQEMEKQSKTI